MDMKFVIIIRMQMDMKGRDRGRRFFRASVKLLFRYQSGGLKKTPE
jgi:hypothetical protein